MSPPPAWHPECRRLDAEGKSILEIMRILGVANGSVRWCLDKYGYRDRERAAASLRSKAARRAAAAKRGPKQSKKSAGAPTAVSEPDVGSPAAIYPEHYGTNVSRPCVDSTVRADALRAYSENRISHAELMDRI